MAIAPEHEWLTIAEAAKLLRVDRSTIRRWIKNGRLPAERFGERAIRISRGGLTPNTASSTHRSVEVDEEIDRLTPVIAERMDEETRLRLLRAVEQSRRRRAMEEAAGIVSNPHCPPAWVLINEARDERAAQLMNE